MVEKILKQYRKEEARILSLELAYKKTSEQEQELLRLQNKHKAILSALSTLKQREFNLIDKLFISKNGKSTLVELSQDLCYSKQTLSYVKRRALKKLDDILEGIEL